MDIKERLRIVIRNVASVAHSLLSVVNFFESAMYPPFHRFFYTNPFISTVVVEILFKF